MILNLNIAVLNALASYQGRFVVIPTLVGMLDGVVKFGREPEMAVMQSINKLQYRGMIERFDLRNLRDGRITGGKHHLTGTYQRAGQTQPEQDEQVKKSLLVFSDPKHLMRGVSAYRISERGLARLALAGMQPTASAIVSPKTNTVEDLSNKLEQLKVQLRELEGEIRALKAS